MFEFNCGNSNDGIRMIRIQFAPGVTEYKAGTPFSREGRFSNDGNAYGLLRQDIRYPVGGRVPVITGGYVNEDEIERSTGTALSEEAKSALKGIIFVTDADPAPWVSAPSGGGTAVASVEPAEDDIPKVFFGGALQQTKDEKVVPFRYISKTQDISGYAEIKAQGNSSMGYPKKNQTVKMYKDADCTEKLKVDFKGWGKQSKHCYKANWIDLSHARNIVSARLWGDVIKSRANFAELPELYRTSPNIGAIDGFPIKVYVDGVYQGRYTLNIPKDAWMANMDDELEEHCILCGENYVSGCFRAAAKIDESDWTDEVHDTVPDSIKTRWNEIIAFVMNSTDDEFGQNLGNYFYIDSLIDYYLFGLASCGLDAFGKNQLYMTYDGQKWIAAMYDMDSTWGLYYNGNSIVATDYSRTKYEDYVNSTGNLLYVRLEELFYTKIMERWAELKSGALSIENIINRFERFTDIAPATLVEEDYASSTGGGGFTGIPSKTTNNIQQIRGFALARQKWCDTYLASVAPEIKVACTGITLSAESLSLTDGNSQTIVATVTPDNTTDAVIWSSNNNSIAMVEDGVVTPIANGECVITARCGNYSNSCNVSVSGFVEPKPCTGISLSETEATISGLNSKTLTATVEPSDTTDTIVWTSDNGLVATVENGVVTAVANGTAVITATCGEQSATCAVSVSGIVDCYYELEQETELTGSNFVDTGFALCDEDKDFTIVLDATPGATQNDGTIVVFQCLYEAGSYAGYSLNSLAGVNYRVIAGTTSQVSNMPRASTTRFKFVLRHAVSGGTSSYFRTTDLTVNQTFTHGTQAVTGNPQNLLIGAYQTTGGAKGRYWTGTMHHFKIYNRALTDAEIEAYLA